MEKIGDFMNEENSRFSLISITPISIFIKNELDEGLTFSVIEKNHGDFDIILTLGNESLTTHSSSQLKSEVEFCRSVRYLTKITEGKFTPEDFERRAFKDELEKVFVSFVKFSLIEAGKFVKDAFFTQIKNLKRLLWFRWD